MTFLLTLGVLTAELIGIAGGLAVFLGGIDMHDSNLYANEETRQSMRRKGMNEIAYGLLAVATAAVVLVRMAA